MDYKVKPVLLLFSVLVASDLVDAVWYTSQYWYATTTARTTSSYYYDISTSNGGVKEAYRIRLVGGGSPSVGRLEVYHNNAWGTVCDDGFSTNEAVAVCNELGFTNRYRTPVAYGGARYGEGYGPIWLDDVQCNRSDYYYNYPFTSCSSLPWGSNNCGHGEDVSVNCFSEDMSTVNPSNDSSFTVDYGPSSNDVRLEYGDRGLVQIYRNGEWGFVCGESFDTYDARVVCRSVGYSSLISYNRNYNNYYYHYDEVWINNIHCYGYERGLYDCRMDIGNITYCPYSGRVYVACGQTTTQDPYFELSTTGSSTGAYKIRLVGGEAPWVGRLEVYHNYNWGTVCDDGFSTNEAVAVCYQLGFYNRYRTPVAYQSARYGQGSGQIWLDNVRCPDRYSHYNFAQCSSLPWGSNNCGHSEDVSVNCFWDEISTVNPSDESFTVDYGPGNSNVRLEYQDHGYVQIYHNGEWGYVCGESFEGRDAEVVCRSLGYSYQNSWNRNYNSYYYHYDQVWINNINCRGYETGLYACRMDIGNITNCFYNGRVYVACGGAMTTQESYFEITTTGSPTGAYQIRLVGGEGPWVGRLEVYHNYNWGTVCDDGFSTNEAVAVCNQLGFYNRYRTPVAYQSASYGQGSGQIWLDEVRCPDKYRHYTFAQCSSNPWGSNDCSHSEDVSVNCYWEEISTVNPTIDTLTPVRLAGGYGYYEGRLEVYHNGEWGTVCSVNFNSNAAHVVCKMLDIDYHRYPTVYYDSSYYGEGSGKVWIDGLSCSGAETDIAACMNHFWGYNGCSHNRDVGINCQRGRDDITTATNTPIRLSSGSRGLLQVYHEGIWGTVCDDYFSAEAAYVVCRSLGYYKFRYPRYYTAGYGSGTIWLDDVRCSGYEYSIDQCRHEYWGQNDCSHKEDVGIDCYDMSDQYTTEQSPLTTENSSNELSYESAIHVGCTSSSWDLRIYLPTLYQRNTDFSTSDITLGHSSCHGYASGDYLYFQQDYSSCSTKTSYRYGNTVYANTLIYAKHDPVFGFIVREYRFQIDVECDMTTYEVVSQDILQSHNQVRAYHRTIHGTGHYDLQMSFFRDSHYQHPIYGSPITANIGQEVYVRVFTDLRDYEINMRLEDCYTLPSTSSHYQKYYLIRDGCPADVNTHVIYTDNHETRFSFKDFEYSTNPNHIYLYCSASFCNATDPYNACDQTCHHHKKRAKDVDRDQHILNVTEVMEVIYLKSHNIKRRDTAAVAEIHTKVGFNYSPLIIVIVLCSAGVVLLVVIGVIRRKRRHRKSKSGSINI